MTKLPYRSHQAHHVSSERPFSAGPITREDLPVKTLLGVFLNLVSWPREESPAAAPGTTGQNAARQRPQTQVGVAGAGLGTCRECSEQPSAPNPPGTFLLSCSLQLQCCGDLRHVQSLPGHHRDAFGQQRGLFGPNLPRGCIRLGVSGSCFKGLVHTASCYPGSRVPDLLSSDPSRFGATSTAKGTLMPSSCPCLATHGKKEWFADIKPKLGSVS